jgi:hypothetical protein
MTRISKIQLSQMESELISNSSWILTKRDIIERIVQNFAQLAEEMKTIVGNSVLPSEIIASNPKISKGENYQGLPYVILDYPALFNKTDVLAVRTMFWWGNFFSVTVHCSGKYKEVLFGNPLLLDELKKGNFMVCVNDDQWQHDFTIENYLPVESLTFSEIEAVKYRSFLKFACRLPVNQWEESESFIMHTFASALEILATSYLACEKGL